jgi:hypothetical protein
MTVLTGERATTTNVLDHEARLRSALATASVAAAPSEHFNPGFELPANSAALRAFFAAADIRFADLGEVGACRLALMDLMGNPGTRTVKTFASLVIVARAVRYIQATGERIMILTPSSANKATALRDAVQRAYRAGLATPHQLQITTVVPAGSRGKLWSSDLATDRELMARNPMCIFGGPDAAAVKQLALAARDQCVAELKDCFGVNLWHTLDLANYRCADSVRAFAEQAAVPPDPEMTRVHAHAVSSAFGLLGHHFGTTLSPEVPMPGYFLVQHLATPDMVVSLHGKEAPAYRRCGETGLYRQQEDPRFPLTTFAPDENLEPTFYTHAPATSPAMNAIIRRHGGGGIVVSLHECLARYPQIRALLAEAGIELPADPRSLREWSLVMVLTGVLNAIDRDLLDAREVVVHGTGSYAEGDFTPIPQRALREVADAAGLSRVLLAAARGEAN